MDEPDFDVKKEMILAKLDVALKLLEDERAVHDNVNLLDISNILLKVEKEVKEY